MVIAALDATVWTHREMLPLRSSDIDNTEVLKRWLRTIEKAKGKHACQTIAVFNPKGGVGKTVTAINLSAMLAAHGRRTLLIDLDPQGQSGLGLGLDIESLESSVYDVLVKGECPIGRAIVRLRPNLEILPSNIDLAAAELEMARLHNKEARLKELIDELRDRYEYVVIDCSPSLRILTINALLAGQIVIVPIIPSFFSIHGLSRVTEVVDALKEAFPSDPRVYFLITFFEKQSKEVQLQERELESTVGQYLLRTVIRKNTKLNEATRKGIPVFEHDRYCPGSRDYLSLAREVMSIGIMSKYKEPIQEEQEPWERTVSYEKEETGDPQGSRESYSEAPKRPEEFELTQREAGSTLAQMKKQRIRPFGAFLIVLVVLLVLVLVVRNWRQKVERTGDEGEIHKIVSVRARAAGETVESQPAGIVSQLEETSAIPSPTLGPEKQEVLVESSAVEVSEGEETLVVASIAEVSESEGPQIEKTKEKVANLKGGAEPIIRSSVTGGGYVVNLASFRQKTRADRYVEDLKKQGLEAFEWEVEVPQKGRWHRVSIGRFSTLKQAQVFAKELEQRGFKTFIARIPTDQKPTGSSKSNMEERATSTDQEQGSPEIQEMLRLLRS